MSKYIKVMGCFDCDKKVMTQQLSNSIGIINTYHCPSNFWVTEHVKAKTIHPGCRLPDYEDIEFIKSQFKIIEQQLKGLINQ